MGPLAFPASGKIRTDLLRLEQRQSRVPLTPYRLLYLQVLSQQETDQTE